MDITTTPASTVVDDDNNNDNDDDDDSTANIQRRQRLKKGKKKKAIKFPPNQEEFFNNLKECFLRNEQHHRLPWWKLNLALKRLIKREKIYNMLKGVEQKLNLAFEEEILRKNENDGNLTLKRDMSPKVKKIISPLCKKLLVLILETTYINDVIKFNVINICFLHLTRYIINDELKKILTKEFENLSLKTREYLKI